MNLLGLDLVTVMWCQLVLATNSTDVAGVSDHPVEQHCGALFRGVHLCGLLQPDIHECSHGPVSQQD